MGELGPRLRRELGDRLLAYVLGLDVPTLERVLNGEIDLPDQSKAAWAAACKILEQEIPRGAVPPDSRVQGQSTVLSYLSMQKAGVPLAVVLHLASGGSRVPEPSGEEDPATKALMSLTSDVFPLTLVEKGPEEALFGRGLSLGFAIRESPHEATFENAVLEDESLRKLFPEHTEQSGHHGAFFTNLGQGSGVQLVMLSEGLIASAVRELELEGDFSERRLIDCVRENLATLRRLVNGEAVTTRLRVGLAGIELDGVKELKTPWGTLRPVREVEHREVEGLGAARASTVLEIELEQRLFLGHAFPETGDWQEDRNAKRFTSEAAKTRRRVSTGIQHLALSFFLAIERKPAFAPVEVWSRFANTFELSSQVSWNPGIFGPGTEEFDAKALEHVAEWADRVDAAETATIEVAIRRVLGAQDLRRTPADGLVDAVIALENLFGTRDPAGEVSFRVSTACAFLLETEPKTRRELQKEINSLYALRSKIVHGTISGDEVTEERDRCVEIVRLCLQRLLRDRPELLSAEPRGTEIIVGGSEL
jgi:hypothetical protein